MLLLCVIPESALFTASFLLKRLHFQSEQHKRLQEYVTGTAHQGKSAASSIRVWFLTVSSCCASMLCLFGDSTSMWNSLIVSPFLSACLRAVRWHAALFVATALLCMAPAACGPRMRQWCVSGSYVHISPRMVDGCRSGSYMPLSLCKQQWSVVEPAQVRFVTPISVTPSIWAAYVVLLFCVCVLVCFATRSRSLWSHL